MTFNEKTGTFDMQEVNRSLRHETPDWISNFWGWITDGRMSGFDKMPKTPKTNITK